MGQGKETKPLPRSGNFGDMTVQGSIALGFFKSVCSKFQMEMFGRTATFNLR